MKYVEIIASPRSAGTVAAIAEKAKAHDFRVNGPCDGGMQEMRMLVTDDRLQSVLDTLQNVLGAQPTARIVVLGVEAVLPKPPEPAGRKEKVFIISREALLERMEKSARLDANYIVLVVLSTTVAAIGLIEDSVAVVIGAMVIAPLLGPNLALSVGTALGEGALVRRSAKTLATGILLTVALSLGLGVVWPGELASAELLSRTDLGLESIVLALASGASTALSLTMGLSSALVGVMVAVALLPPAVTFGVMAGTGDFALALGAALLLVANIVCVNLASKLVFLAKGVLPRRSSDQKKARRTLVAYVVGWLVLLLVLIVVMYARRAILG